jgi:hypothetical protein
VLTYLILEFVAFRLLLPHLPLKLRGDLPKEIRVLAQPSKRSTIPTDYIALVGDSYAAGFGDWVRDSNHWLNPPFHSADLIHQATGRDVITFGASGAGSLTGLVSAPMGRLRYLDASWLYALKPPRVIVVYFYAGNDFNDNLQDLELRFHPNFPGRDVRDQEVFGRFLTTVVLGGDESWAKAEEGLSLIERLFFLRTLETLSGDIWKDLASFPNRPARRPRAARIPAGQTNRVMVRGERVAVPDGLQSPGLELDDAEMALATYVFEEALRYLRRYFATSTVRVVYIPSPLECYKIASPEVDILRYEGRRPRYRVEELEHRRRLAVTAIQRATEANGLVFLDATPHLRSASRSEPVHGPKDWKHFNRAGYEALARAVLTILP